MTRFLLNLRARRYACAAATIVLTLPAGRAHSQAPRVQAADTVFDLVVLHGRVLDPESGLDAQRNLGVGDGVIRSVSSAAIRGRDTIDATGLVVAPGFIDLHQHAQTPDAYRVEATGGITSALEMEYGTADVDGWYAARAGQAAINYGVSVGHAQVRKVVMHDPSAARADPLADPTLADPAGDAKDRPATPAERAEIQRLIARGLERGAVGVGMIIEYTPGASRREIVETFATAARYGATCHVHLRGVSDDPDDFSDIQEVLADAVLTGASLHVVHINSTARELTPDYLAMIASARAHGVDVTTEMYPYEASMTSITGVDTTTLAAWDDARFHRIEVPQTGERLTRATFARFYALGGDVIVHASDTAAAARWLHAAVASPLPIFATDGILSAHGGHPRAVGTFARILGEYVREEHVLTLMEAVRRMTLAPAQRLERRVPAMRHKGRIRSGADADLVVFDASTIADRATYRDPTRAPAGMKAVIVNGVPVVRDGRLVAGRAPGRPIRGVRDSGGRIQDSGP